MASKSQLEVSRPLADYPSSIWDYDELASLPSNDSAIQLYTNQVEDLKAKVRDMLMALSDDDNPVEKVKLIDLLDQLGLSYHFEREIEDSLNQIFDIEYPNIFYDNDLDLSTISLMFRVFRQHGYKISCDVFNKFKDIDGKFKVSLASDVKGMLSLYETSHLSIHGEEILDEAITYTTSNLNSSSLESQCSPHLAKHISYALNQPFHKGVPRIETRRHISFYEQDDSSSPGEMLLKFAKIDFNRLQLLHLQELSDVARWCKDINVAKKFPYARDRLVEIYMWAVGTFFEPHYSRARIITTKMVMIATITDDTYDAYGTIEELRPFTDAIQRWDFGAIDQVPDNMKLLYKTILDLYHGFENELEDEGRSCYVSYVKDAVKQVIRNYLVEAEWLNKGCIPTFEEYMENAMTSTCYHAIAIASLLGMGEVAGVKEFEWLKNIPKIDKASMIICRLIDDIVSPEHEEKREHIATGIEIYMKQYNVSREEAIEEFQRQVTSAWKDINEEFIKPTPVSRDILMRFLNLARFMEVLYKHQDAYSINPDYFKPYINMLFFEPIPIQE